jgi:hypothetical protein
MLDEYIKNKVDEYLSEEYPAQEYDDVYSDTFSELIDKLIIVHIRYWMLEDEMGIDKDDAVRIGLLKAKADNLFKEKRPMLVQALDKMIFKIARGDISYTPVNNKLYKGTK